MDNEAPSIDQLLAMMKPRTRRVTTPIYTPENALETTPAAEAKPAPKATAKTPPKSEA